MVAVSMPTPSSAAILTDGNLTPSEWKLTVPKFRCLQPITKGNRAYWSAVLNRGFQDGFVVIGNDTTHQVNKALFKIKWVHSDISHLSFNQIMSNAQNQDAGTSAQATKDWNYYRTHLASAVVTLHFHYGLVYQPIDGKWYRAVLDEDYLQLDGRMSAPQRTSFGYPTGIFGDWPMTFLTSLEKSGCQYFEIAELINRANQDLPLSKQISEENECCTDYRRLIKQKNRVLPWAVN